MPVHYNLPSETVIYQRAQYEKGGIGRWYWDYRDRVTFSYIMPHHRSIIDLGCGEGIGLEKLTHLFPDRRVIGIDLDRENIEICKRHGLHVLYSDICELAIPDNSFDVCLCIDVFEHIDRPHKALGEIRRVLTPRGRLIMVLPHDRNFFIARLSLCMFREAFYKPGHVRQWVPDEARRLLMDEGFAIISSRSIPFIFWHTSLHHIIVADRV